MLLLLADPAPGCVAIEFDIATVLDLLLILVAILIPSVAVIVVARIVRRNPSAALLSAGRRSAGIRLRRWGFAVTAVGMLGFIACLLLAGAEPGACDQDTVLGTLILVSVLTTFVGALLIGVGWAYAIRASWLALATLAILDSWIFLVNLLVGLAYTDSTNALLLLAFAIHGLCSCVAARWMLTTKDLGPIERAKAGEAGRSLSAVWVFLASYAGLALLREENGVFSTPAGSAVTGALTVGALAVTMGSGFTKYIEAVNAKPPVPAVTTPTESEGDDQKIG